METLYRPDAPDRRAGARGFTLVELIVVVAIIALLSAVVAPNIARYVRNYKIRGEANGLVTNLQKARNQAIMKNVNLGVAVVVQDPQTYWVHLEDDQVDQADMTREVTRQALNVAAPDRVQSAVYRLGNDVRFAVNAAECPNAPGGAFTPTSDRLRFSRLGAWCTPGNGCPNVLGPVAPATLPTMTNAIRTAGAQGMLCVVEMRTGLSRWITISAGGRIAAQQ